MRFLIKIVVLFLVINCITASLSDLNYNDNVGSTIKVEETSNMQNNNLQSENYSANNGNNINKKYVYIILNKVIDVARITLNLFENTLDTLENNQDYKNNNENNNSKNYSNV